MNLTYSINDAKKTPASRGLSLRQRLPLMMGLLLLGAISSFAWISYIGVRKTSLNAGKERLTIVTSQLSNMFGQSGPNTLTTNKTAAAKEPLKKIFTEKLSVPDTAVTGILKRLTTDSTWISVELIDADGHQLIHEGRLDPSRNISLKQVISDLALGADQSKIGKLYTANDSIFYPIVTPVTENKRLLGYLVRWRLQMASKKAINDFSKLIGTDAILIIGNADGSLWTDLRKPVRAPIDSAVPTRDPVDFSINGDKLLGAIQQIPNTPWVVLVGFKKKNIVTASDDFLRSALIIGGLLFMIGLSGAYWMSRNITRPLKKLTAATAAVSTGQSTFPSLPHRTDEIGKLTHAFQLMNEQVQSARMNLEEKVEQRTGQLLEVNKELEAFSYSVSHDLRAPLRAISGYAMMLKEDHGENLNDEANRVMDRIVTNAQMMGQLIDGLIAFSKMGATEMVTQAVDMNELVKTCLEETVTPEMAGKYQIQVNPLAACTGDRQLLKQVWMNLIGNAIKYSAPKPVACIEIGCREGTPFNKYFIRDNGVGFDMKHADKLFGVFQRLHSRKEFEGTGIGLAFVKRIILKLGGEIRASATPGQGAEFSFTLPEVQVHANNINRVEKSKAISQGQLFQTS